MVDSARYFELNATISGDRGNLRPGKYTLKQGMKNGDVLAALTKAPATPTAAPAVKLTIVEGPSRKENAKVVDDSEKVKGSYAKATASKETLGADPRARRAEGHQDRRRLPVPGDLRAPRGLAGAVSWSTSSSTRSRRTSSRST